MKTCSVPGDLVQMATSMRCRKRKRWFYNYSMIANPVLGCETGSSRGRIAWSWDGNRVPPRGCPNPHTHALPLPRHFTCEDLQICTWANWYLLLGCRTCTHKHSAESAFIWQAQLSNEASASIIGAGVPHFRWWCVDKS